MTIIKQLKNVAFLFILFYTNLLANTIIINEDTINISVLENSYKLIDKESKHRILDIVKFDKNFTPITNKFINYGYMFKDTLWIKFNIKNNSNKDILKYLIFDSPNIDIINLYFYKDNKKNLIKNGIFNRESFESELSFNFKLSLDSKETQTYYLELKPITHSLHFTLKIKDYKKFKNDELHHQLILVVFFSILFVIIIYNTVIFINSKNTIYVYYSLFIFTIFIHHFSITGMIGYFLPSNPEIITMQAYMPLYNLSFILISIFLFVSKFLNLYLYKKIYFILKLFILVIIALCLIHSKENYLLNYLTPAALLFALYIEFIGLYLFIKTKEKNAKYFFLIWSISLGGMIGTILYYIGVLSSPIPYLFEITVTFEALLFSIVLASRIKELEKEKLDNNKMILEQSKLASMGEMLQNIAHQWRQPLSEINAVAMKIDADYYKKRLNSTSLEIDLQRIENITFHMSSTIESFNSFFKENKQLDTITVKSLVKKALDIMDGSLKDIKIKFIIDDTLKIKINISEFIQVILVILNNSVDALITNKIKNKIITINVKNINNKYIIEINDNAGGIKEENLTRIFEPYFTTKFKSDGIGIGLYMAKKIVEDSLKGTINVLNTKNGARFTITL